MKTRTTPELLDLLKGLKVKLNSLLVERPVTVGFQWQRTQEQISEVTAELLARGAYYDDSLEVSHG